MTRYGDRVQGLKTPTILGCDLCDGDWSISDASISKSGVLKSPNMFVLITCVQTNFFSWNLYEFVSVCVSFLPFLFEFYFPSILSVFMFHLKKKELRKWSKCRWVFLDKVWVFCVYLPRTFLRHTERMRRMNMTIWRWSAFPVDAEHKQTCLLKACMRLPHRLPAPSVCLSSLISNHMAGKALKSSQPPWSTPDLNAFVVSQVVHNAAAVYCRMGQWEQAREVLQQRSTGGGGHLEAALDSIEVSVHLVWPH